MRKAIVLLFILLLAQKTLAQEVINGSRRYTGPNIIFGPTTAGNVVEVRFREASANGANYVVLKSPASLGANVVLTLPSVDAAGVLRSNGSGILSFDANISHLASSTSAQLASVLSDETGNSGGFLRAQDAAGILRSNGSGALSFDANISHLASSTSAQLASVLSDETGTGGGFVRADSPTISTPTISGAISFQDGIRQTFNPDGTNAGINVGAHTSDPSSPTNGDLWYNSTTNELKARINGANVALGSGSGGSSNAVVVQDRDVTTATVVNTTTETTVYSYTVPGGTLGTDGALRLSLIGELLNNTGSTQAATIKVYWGGNLILNTTGLDAPTSSNRRAVVFHIMLAANNSASAQIAAGRCTLSAASGNSTTMLGESTVVHGVNNNISVDSTTNKSLEVKVTLSTNSTNLEFKLFVAFLEKL